MNIEQLIQVMREQDYTLDLVSTIVRAKSKYSARFFHISEEVCDECDGNIPNEWNDYSHANTMEEAVLAAMKVLGDRDSAVLVNIEETLPSVENTE
jgi:hypothetical protein